MLKGKQKTIKALILVILFLITIIIFMPKTYAGVVNPESDEKIQFRAVSLEENNGNKQLIVEAYIQNLDFKAIDLRLQYDSTLLSLSDIETNEIVSIDSPLDVPANFEFCNNFDQIMELAGYNNTTGELRLLFSGLTEDEVTGENDYYIIEENIGEYIHTSTPVLIGRFSFQVGEGELTEDTISLKEAATSPTTGLKINIDGQGNYYEEPSIFEFVLDLESDNAYLSNIILSTGEVDEENPDNSTYKEYDLDPEFDKETFIYNVEILEYIDKMNLKITKDDINSTIKMKVPKRDEDGNLMYEEDETTIIYEEKEITDSENLTQEVLTEFVLNKLGEPDTIIELKVTAEDGKSTQTYIITISRPFGTIKGSISTEKYTKDTTGKNICEIYVYNQDDVAEIFDWDQRISDFNLGKDTDTINSDLHSIQEACNVTTNDDGTFEIKVIPGTYDILQDKPGYLDHIYIYLTLNAGDEIDLGNYDLVAGDSNKDGIVQIKDKVLVTEYNGKSIIDSEYDEAYDFNNDGEIQIKDKVIVTEENGSQREIVNYQE